MTPPSKTVHDPDHEYIGHLGEIGYYIAGCKCGWQSNCRSEHAAQNAWQRHVDVLDEDKRREKAGPATPERFKNPRPTKRWGQAASAPRLMYHWAPKDARSVIEQDGLQLAQPPHEEGEDRYPSGVFLFDDQPNATYYTRERTPEDHDLWEVNVDGLEMLDDPMKVESSDPHWDNSYYVKENISPSRLKRVGARKEASKSIDFDALRRMRSEVRNHEIGHDAPDAGQCAFVSEVAQNEHGLDIDAGWYVDPHSPHPAMHGRGFGDHVWNTTKDGTIIDITHDQFAHEGEPDILVAPSGHPLRERYHSFCDDPKCLYCTDPELNPDRAADVGRTAKEAQMSKPPEQPPPKCPACGNRHDEFGYCSAVDDNGLEGYSFCPACGSPSDYCQGGGPDSDHERLVQKHFDKDIHDECDPGACDEAGRYEYDVCTGCNGKGKSAVHPTSFQDSTCGWCKGTGLMFVRSVKKESKRRWEANNAPLWHALQAERPALAKTVNDRIADWDEWLEDPWDGGDYAQHAGLCGHIAQDMSEHLRVQANLPDRSCLHISTNQDHDWAVVHHKKEAYAVDVPWGLYEKKDEQGHWQSRFAADTIEPQHIRIRSIRAGDRQLVEEDHAAAKDSSFFPQWKGPGLEASKTSAWMDQVSAPYQQDAIAEEKTDDAPVLPPLYQEGLSLWPDDEIERGKRPPADVMGNPKTGGASLPDRLKPDHGGYEECLACGGKGCKECKGSGIATRADNADLGRCITCDHEKDDHTWVDDGCQYESDDGKVCSCSHYYDPIQWSGNPKAGGTKMGTTYGMNEASKSAHKDADVGEDYSHNDEFHKNDHRHVDMDVSDLVSNLAYPMHTRWECDRQKTMYPDDSEHYLQDDWDYWSSTAGTGVDTPIEVGKQSDGYWVRNGHHRLAWAKEQGLRTVPAILYDSPYEKKASGDGEGLPSHEAQVQRVCVRCKKDFSESEHGEATGFCGNCRELEGMVDHAWDSKALQEGHYGHGPGYQYATCKACGGSGRDRFALHRSEVCSICDGSGLIDAYVSGEVCYRKYHDEVCCGRLGERENSDGQRVTTCNTCGSVEVHGPMFNEHGERCPLCKSSDETYDGKGGVHCNNCTWQGTSRKGRIGALDKDEYFTCHYCEGTGCELCKGSGLERGLPPKPTTEESVCRHCQRRIIYDENHGWVDPEATGDDRIWRETCDAHDTFTAEHEPQDNGKKTGSAESPIPSQSVPKEAGYAPCRQCDGTGIMDSCLACDGDGRYLADDPIEGDIEKECEPCNGTGSYTTFCDLCKGSGLERQAGPIEKDARVRPATLGIGTPASKVGTSKGFEPCPTCDGSNLACQECHGSGIASTEALNQVEPWGSDCPACSDRLIDTGRIENGTGLPIWKSPDDCPVCHGEGTLPEPLRDYLKKRKEGSLQKVAIHSDIPSKPGTAPIPEGHVRIYHSTWAEPKEIKKTGLLIQKAKDSYERGGTEFPAIFGYAGWHPVLDTHESGGGANVVEFHLHPDDLDTGHFSEPEDLAARRSTVTTMKDVPPENIVAVHEPWHAQYRMIKADPRVEEAVLAGEHDWVLDSGSDYDFSLGEAIRKVKAEQGKTAGFDPSGIEGDADELGEGRGIPKEHRKWLLGYCSDYATALHKRNPRLKFGQLVLRGDDKGGLGPVGEDELSDYEPVHVFVHDDLHAYDATGRHVLPYHAPYGGPRWMSPEERKVTDGVYGLGRNDIVGQWGESNPELEKEALEHWDTHHGRDKIKAEQIREGEGNDVLPVAPNVCHATIPPGIPCHGVANASGFCHVHAPDDD